MSNIFNAYFVNVADDINKSVPKPPNSSLRYIDSAIKNSLFLSPVTHLEIKDLMANLNSSKSIGPYSIPIKLLKIPTFPIHWASLSTNVSKLKLAKVVPVFKKGDPEIRSNYRPISLVPIFSKIFKKPMYERLYSFVTRNKIIYPLQFGFQENHFIDHALISMTETIRRSLYSKKYGVVFLLTYKKLLIL